MGGCSDTSIRFPAACSSSVIEFYAKACYSFFLHGIQLSENYSPHRLE
jgi:hypothetical protein